RSVPLRRLFFTARAALTSAQSRLGGDKETSHETHSGPLHHVAFPDAPDRRSLLGRRLDRGPDDLGPSLLANAGWFDPGELTGTVTSYHTLYALHDAMIRPSPGQPMAPSLAESWSASPDGLVYDFVIRKGVKFHSGDPVTGEDVKFSFERYRGNAHRMLRDKVASMEVSDPGTGALPAPATVAGLPDLLFQCDGRRLDRAEEICREGR